MSLTPTREGLIKQHPHKDIVPKSEHHMEAPHPMNHIIKKPTPKPVIMSKVRQQQKEYIHSIGSKFKQDIRHGKPAIIHKHSNK